MKLPALSEELYQHYPAMSAQTHEAEVKAYALKAYGLATQPASVACPCTMIEQGEDCTVGYPSSICGVCKGTGHTTPDQVTALACEMLKIASDVGEPEDPFAAWESISLLQSQAERHAGIAEEFARSRSLPNSRPTERVLGRYEGEQAASSEIARRIRAVALDANGGDRG